VQQALVSFVPQEPATKEDDPAWNGTRIKSPRFFGLSLKSFCASSRDFGKGAPVSALDRLVHRG
jgi:hypothetical protein